MNEVRFTAEERADLISWFANYPISRFWVRDIDDGLALVGYLTNTETPLDDLRLRMDGHALPDVAWHTWEGLADPDNDPDPSQFRVFRWWPSLKGYGFRAELSFSDMIEAGANREFLRIDFAERNGRSICDPTQALFLPMTDIRRRLDAPRPPPHLITRVMGNDAATEWQLTGYTDLRVFAEIVWEALGPDIAARGPVLEWGSGCGRLSRHLIQAGFPMVGIDIDAEAVDWCNANLAEARFITCGLLPPTTLAAQSFGMAIGISVITHLDEPAADAWLAELARLLRPNGILLLTTHGLDTFSSVTDAPIYRALRQSRFVSMRSGHLDEVLGTSQDYYRETWHSWDYIRTRWTTWFNIVTIRRGAHFGYQDLVVLQRKP